VAASNSFVRAITDDLEGNLWVAAGSGGLIALRAGKVATINPPDNWQGRAALSISSSRDGSIWITTEGAGLYRFTSGQWEHFGENEGLSNLFAWSALEDEAGKLWVGTWGGGAYTPRATARIGRLILRQGDWEGRQILTTDAVRQVAGDAGLTGNCGMGWWSNGGRRYPGLPKDAVWGAGAGDQLLLVVPGLNLIMVRNGETLVPGAGEPPVRTNDVFTLYAGNCTTVTDQAGKARKSCSDALGRLTQVLEDPAVNSYETDYTYDTLNNLVTVTQQGGTTSGFWRNRNCIYRVRSALRQAQPI